MNLPFEYNKLSEYFDALGSSSPDSINRSIGKILKKYKVKTVLDLTCGTGSQVLWLAKHGYQVTGSDLSLNLLKIAKSKVQGAGAIWDRWCRIFREKNAKNSNGCKEIIGLY